MTMTAEFSAGGCERCGKQDHVTYSHWQFLCSECRDVLALSQLREHEHAVLQARIEAAGQERGKPRARAEMAASG